MESYYASSRSFLRKITVGKSAILPVWLPSWSDAKKIADHESGGFIRVGRREGERIRGKRQPAPKSCGLAGRQSQRAGLARRESDGKIAHFMPDVLCICTERDGALDCAGIRAGMCDVARRAVQQVASPQVPAAGLVSNDAQLNSEQTAFYLVSLALGVLALNGRKDSMSANKLCRG